MLITTRQDNGLTLPEVLITTVIMSTVIAGITALLIAVANLTVTGRDHTEAVTGARQVVNAAGRSVGSAAALNPPATHGGNHYFEYLTTATSADQAPQCTQWRYTTASGQLHRRTWDTLHRNPTSWTLEAEHVTNNPTTDPIFTLIDPGDNFKTPFVAITIQTTTPDGTTAHSSADFAVHNIDHTATTPICNEVGRT